MNQLYIHDFFHADGPKSFEYLYPLELSSIESKDHRRLLSDQCSFFPLTDKAEAKKYLESLWGSITDQTVKNFSELVADSEIRSVLIFRDECWLVFQSKGFGWKKTEIGLPGFLLLPFSVVEANDRGAKHIINTEKERSYFEFFEYFGGMSECLPPVTQRVEQSFWESYKKIVDWPTTSLSEPFYYTISGDFLAFDQTQRVVRYYHEGVLLPSTSDDEELQFSDKSYEVVYEDFDTFLREYLKMIKKGMVDGEIDKRHHESHIY